MCKYRKSYGKFNFPATQYLASTQAAIYQQRLSPQLLPGREYSHDPWRSLDIQFQTLPEPRGQNRGLAM